MYVPRIIIRMKPYLPKERLRAHSSQPSVLTPASNRDALMFRCLSTVQCLKNEGDEQRGRAAYDGEAGENEGARVGVFRWRVSQVGQPE